MKIRTLFLSKEKPDYRFKPESDFYERLGINRLRFWKLFKGEKEATISEVEKLANYLGIDKTELL